MTGRRRSGRKAGSTSKKETPEKSRRSTRRRGYKKSDSEPEADDSVSERSFEEQDKSQLDVDPLALASNDGILNDGNKGEESGGSDGAWQVRSENGNKGGIPKLKICLQRPADMSSPTSDTLPSPRARRSRRGATASPSKPDNNEETAADEASSAADGETERRSTRSRRQVDKKEEVEEPEVDLEAVKKAAEQAEAEAKQRAAEQAEAEAKQIAAEAERKQKAVAQAEAEKKQKAAAQAEAERKQKLAEQAEAEAKQRAAEQIKKLQQEKEAAAKVLEEKKRQELEARRVEELEKESRRKREAAEAAAAEERKRAAEKKRALEEKEKALEKEKRLEAERKQQMEEERKKRSPSRDSSEERAKEAALRSRKVKKDENSDASTPTFPARNGGRIRTSGLDGSTPSKDNSQESSSPVVRKRRWGSTSTSNKQHPVAISTDVLKEIIPEAKLVPLSEVQLSPNRDEELEGNMDIDITVENDVQPSTTAPRRRHSVLSDESEKDYEEEGVDSGGEEMVKKRTPIDTNHVDVPPKNLQNDLRKVVVTETIFNDLKQRSPSPAKHAPSNILYITNLVRPFTVVQLRDLLARTGSIVPEKGFWIDGIKSRCYVKYTSEEEAKTTRHALHGIQWPASNPKQLTVDFGTEQAMLAAIEGIRAQSPMAKRVVTEDRRDRERDRIRVDENPKHSVDARGRVVDEERSEKPSRTVRKITAPVREWDVGKTERGISPPFLDSRRFDDDKRDRDRFRRSSSGEPSRKVKRTEERGTKKVLLDDLFRKTKATPCIYWLPLTTPQKLLKEEMRRKHMEEHEKQLAEHRKRREAKTTQKQRSLSRSSKK